MTSRPEWVGPKLVKVVEDTVWALQALTDTQVLGVDQVGRDVVKLAAMPKLAVARAEGLAFVKRHKVGAVLGVTTERVVLIRRTTQQDGSTVWSAPVFLRGRSFSLGFTAGSFRMAMCTAIGNDSGMSNVMRPHRNLGINAAFLLDMNGSRLRRLRTSSSGAQSQVQVDKQGGMMAKYYLMEAGMVDLSCRGGSFGLDQNLNSAVYGPGFDAQDALQGKVQPPPEFQTLYTRLNEMVKEVRATHPRIGLSDKSVGGVAPTLSRHNSVPHSVASSDKQRRSTDSTADWLHQQQPGPPRVGRTSSGADSADRGPRHAHFVE